MDSPELTFEFVEDAPLRSVLEEYYRQAQKAAAGEAYLGVIVCCGSVVEGLLTWALLQRPEALESGKAPRDKQGQALPLERWGLSRLIDVGVDLGIIGNTARQASWALRDFRNFIHPFNVLQQSARPDAPLAMSAVGALAEIRRSLEGHLRK